MTPRIVPPRRKQRGFIIDPFRFGAASADPYAAFVVSYVPYSNAMGLVAKVGPNPTTNTGTPAINPATGPFGGALGALQCGAGTTIISGLSTIGTQDFVVEFWYSRLSGGDYTLVDFRPTSTQGVYPMLMVSGGSGGLQYWVSSGNRIIGGALGSPTWFYTALARSSGTSRIYAGSSGTAVQQGSDYTDANSYGGTDVRFGLQRYNFANVTFDGYICEFRLTIGTDRGFNGASISVPTARFPN